MLWVSHVDSSLIFVRKIRSSYLKFSIWFLAGIASVIPVLAIPVNYTMTFTGGPFENGVQINFAPASGSFSYDTTTGFSNFLVNFGSDTFDFTAAANAPTICSTVSSCSPGTAVEEFQELTTHGNWTDHENSSFTFGVSGINSLVLGDFHGPISAQAAGFSNFTGTSPPAVGAFTISAVPEPGTLEMFFVAALFLFQRTRAKRARRGFSASSFDT
jgi:hypothetical protein